MSAQESDIGADTFRKVLSYYPTGVSVVTGSTVGEGPVGLVVGTFTSLSLEGPWCLHPGEVVLELAEDPLVGCLLRQRLGCGPSGNMPAVLGAGRPGVRRCRLAARGHRIPYPQWLGGVGGLPDRAGVRLRRSSRSSWGAWLIFALSRTSCR